MKRFFLSLFLLGLALWPAPAFAQETPDLVVSLRDERGAGVAVTVIVRDGAGRRDLARATTGADGVTTFAALPISEVRVAVDGALPGGAALYQPGDDARGIRVWLDSGATRLDLRAAPDGMVQPDPATMIAQEAAPLALAALPTPEMTAPVEIARPELQRPASQALAPSATPLPEARPDASEGAFPLGALALVGALAAMVAGVALLGRRV
jgi:hypothetical protein